MSFRCASQTFFFRFAFREKRLQNHSREIGTPGCSYSVHPTKFDQLGDPLHSFWLSSRIALTECRPPEQHNLSGAPQENNARSGICEQHFFPMMYVCILPSTPRLLAVLPACELQVLPRVLPDEDELDRLRRRMEQKLDDLLGLSWSTSPSAVDNSPPLRYGFSSGLHLAFHGESNRWGAEGFCGEDISPCLFIVLGHC